MPPRSRREELHRLGDLITEAEGRGGEPGVATDLSRSVAETWPQAVGPEISANARPVSFRAGRLVVSTSSSAWAQTLHLMSEAIRSSLNERLGPDTVERVIFRHAGWERPPAAGGADAAAQDPATGGRPIRDPLGASRADAIAPPGALTREQEAALEDLANLGLDPALEARIAAAMRAVFVRGEQDPGR